MILFAYELYLSINFNFPTQCCMDGQRGEFSHITQANLDNYMIVNLIVLKAMVIWLSYKLVATS